MLYLYLLYILKDCDNSTKPTDNDIIDTTRSRCQVAIYKFKRRK